MTTTYNHDKDLQQVVRIKQSFKALIFQKKLDVTWLYLCMKNKLCGRKGFQDLRRCVEVALAATYLLT